MELYIEYVIMDNLIMDSLIIKSVLNLFKTKIKKINLILFLLLGCISSIFLPYLWHNVVFSFIYKSLVSIVLVMMIKRFVGIKEFIKYYFVFLFITIIFSGVMYGLINLLGLGGGSSIKIYSYEFPMGVLILIVAMCYWFIKKMIKLLQYQLKIANYLYDIKVVDGEHSVEAVGFFDSGNNVEFNGDAINIISINLFMELYKDFPIEKLIFRNVANSNLKNPMYINIEGISNGEKFLSFIVDKIEIKNKIFNNVRIAVSMKNFENFDCILHHDLVGGI